MIVLRLAKSTSILHQPDTGTEWEAHPYPCEDGIPEYTPQHVCGALGWEQFRFWWYDTAALKNAAETHSVYLVGIPDAAVLVGKHQVMFRPQDATWIQRANIQTLLEHEARGADMDFLIDLAVSYGHR